MRKKHQQEEDDYVQQVEDLFDELNYLVSDGSMTPATLLLLRNKAEAEQNLALKRACEMLI